MGAMTDFFISRNKADKDWAVWIAYQLEQAGFVTVLQDWDFRPGSNFALEMQAAADAERTIAVLSPDYLSSEYTAPEWATAFAADPKGANRKLVPILVRDCEPTGLLAPIIHIDLMGREEDDARNVLLAGVKRERTKPSMPPAFPGKKAEQQPSFPGDVEAASVGNGGRTNTRQRSKTDIITRVDELEWGVPPDRNRGFWTGDVWLGRVMVPKRHDEPFIDVLELGNLELHEQLQRLALFGRSAVFRSTRQTGISEREDHVALGQRDNNRIQSMLEAHTDGTLIYRTVVEGRTRSSTVNLADVHVIDEQAVLIAITAFLAFSNAYYDYRAQDTGDLYLGISLSDIERKHFGRLPDYPVSEFTVGDPRIPDPLHVPSTPIRTSSSELENSDKIAKTAVAHIARRFHLEDAYYIP